LSSAFRRTLIGAQTLPAQVTSRPQVNGYRFLLRRLEHALIRGDSRMIHDPMRGQMRALLVGVVSAVLIAGAAGVLAFFKPAPNFGDAAIMLNKSDGTLLVRIGDRLHPVLNLASARLITGKNLPPKEVDDKFLNAVGLGPTVGIVGAPNGVHGGDDMATSSWTVCDSTDVPSVNDQSAGPTVETSVLANDPVLGGDIAEAAPQQMILTTADDTTFLIYDGVRAVIDPANKVLYNALHLGDGEIRNVSPGLLNSFPLVDPITPITIQGFGEPTEYLPGTYRVGAILKTVDSRGEHLYVVLREGVQLISAATADVIRYSNPQMAAPAAVSPAMVASVPIVHTLRVDHYPTASPQLVRADPDRVVCMSWQRGNAAAEATSRLLVGHRLPLPDGAQPVPLAGADGGGSGLDSVYLKPGTGEYVQSTGGEPDSRAKGPLFYVSDLGLRFHVQDEPTAAALGAVGTSEPGRNDATPQPAPWPVLSLLPPGPELSQQAALIVHDGIAADPKGVTMAPPTH
jgi:type VII secretion protein EccB